MTDYQITRVLAETCMGWTLFPFEVDDNSPDGLDGLHFWGTNPSDVCAFGPDDDCAWNPLTDDRAWAQCVDKMAESYDVDLTFADQSAPYERHEPYNRGPRMEWICRFTKRMEPDYLIGPCGRAEHANRLRATAIAILKALGCWTEEEEAEG